MSSLSVNSIKQRAVQGLLFNFLRGQRTKNRAKWSPPSLGNFSLEDTQEDWSRQESKERLLEQFQGWFLFLFPFSCRA